MSNKQNKFENICSLALDICKEKGATNAEIKVGTNESFSVSSKNQNLETVSFDEVNSLNIDGAKGRNFSLLFILRLIISFICSLHGFAKIDLLPSALGPHSILF